LSACQADADCGVGNHCENSYCIADCSDNDSCPSNHVCTAGRCVAEGNEIYGQCQGIEPIHFDFDRYEVKQEYQSYVDRVGQCLEKNPGYSVTVQGHTDDRGTPSYNMLLGKKRADAVQNALKENNGISPKRVKTQSFGDQKPLSHESTEEGWQQNRRAEFVLGTN
jgi:peptidoglycan-associated lipoprotein